METTKQSSIGGLESADAESFAAFPLKHLGSFKNSTGRRWVAPLPEDMIVDRRVPLDV